MRSPVPATPAIPDPWYDAERELLPIAGRALARALRRPRRVVAIAVALTATMVALRAVKAPAYKAAVLFRVEEGNVASVETEQRQPPRDLREHIANVALSKQQVEAIMRKYHVSEGWLARDREAAIEDFRSEISIEVNRDYFIYPRRPGDPPRSAHVSIAMVGPDAEVARAILREIGEAVLQAQKDEKRGALDEAGRVLRAEIAAAQEQARSLQEEVGRLWTESLQTRRAPSVAVEAQLAALEARHATALERLQRLERRAAETEFDAAAVQGELGPNFASFDERLTPLTPRLTFSQLLRRGIVVLLVMLVLVALAVGAFDDHVWGPEDLAVRRLPILGVLRRFPGDEVGSFRERTQSART